MFKSVHKFSRNLLEAYSKQHKESFPLVESYTKMQSFPLVESFEEKCRFSLVENVIREAFHWWKALKEKYSKEKLFTGWKASERKAFH